MTSFSKHLLGKKLSVINQSKESIETLALWIYHHRKHASTIVKLWSREFIIVSEKQKVAFLFLANEIIRSKKSKEIEVFRKEFEIVLPEIFYRIGQTIKNPIQMSKVHRLLNVWHCEGLFSIKILERFWRYLNKNSTSFKTSKEDDDSDLRCNEKQDIKKLILAMKAPSSEELIHALESFQDFPSSDFHVRDQINGLPKTLLETKNIYNLRNTKEADEFSEQLKNAAQLVKGYNERLEEELKQRTNFCEMLLGYKEAELERVADVEKKIKQVKKEIKEKLHLCEELKRHRECLPDLNQLSNVTVLPPLPTAEDLFKKKK